MPTMKKPKVVLPEQIKRQNCQQPTPKPTGQDDHLAMDIGHGWVTFNARNKVAIWAAVAIVALLMLGQCLSSVLS